MLLAYVDPGIGSFILQFCVLLAMIIPGVVFGFICRHLARQKGRESYWFWAGFFLWVIGLLWVGFLPRKETPGGRSA